MEPNEQPGVFHEEVNLFFFFLPNTVFLRVDQCLWQCRAGGRGGFDQMAVDSLPCTCYNIKHAWTSKYSVPQGNLILKVKLIYSTGTVYVQFDDILETSPFPHWVRPPEITIKTILAEVEMCPCGIPSLLFFLHCFCRASCTKNSLC